VHPYWVTNKDMGHAYDVALMHNGTFQLIQVDYDLSDSHNLAVYFLRPILEETPELYMSDAFWHLVSGLIGKNKLVLLNSEGKFIIVNSGLGRIMEPYGAWVSSETILRPINLPDTTNARLPALAASKAAPKGSMVDGHWVLDVDGHKHFRLNEPKLTLEDLAGQDRDTVYDLVHKFPSLATDFLLEALDRGSSNAV